MWFRIAARRRYRIMQNGPICFGCQRSRNANPIFYMSGACVIWINPFVAIAKERARFRISLSHMISVTSRAVKIRPESSRARDVGEIRTIRRPYLPRANGSFLCVVFGRRGLRRIETHYIII